MMEYREFLPSAALRSIVECYWSVRGNSTGSYLVYPDSCMDILYDFGTSEALVIGTMFTAARQTLVGATDVFGIRFHGAGMRCLLRSPLSEFNDANPLLSDVYKLAPTTEQLRPLGLQQRASLLDRWLLKYVVLPRPKPDAWEYCLNKIIERSGNVSVYDLSREVGISQKQMERKFTERVGPTPKQFAQLLKFRKLREYLDTRQHKSLMEVAFDFGFTDSAHLTKFFRKFAGITPSEYLNY